MFNTALTSNTDEDRLHKVLEQPNKFTDCHHTLTSGCKTIHIIPSERTPHSMTFFI